MIQITREDNNILVKVAVPIPGLDTWTYTFRTSWGDKDYMALLVVAMQDHLRARMQEVRREAYERGWADAKSKRTKQDHFAGVL